MKVNCKLDDENGCYFIECVTDKEIYHVTLDAPCELITFPIGGGKSVNQKFDSPSDALSHIESKEER